MTRYDITAIGEGGLRLSVPSGTRLQRTESLDVAIAGTEANVLSGLSSLGWRSGWFSALPKTPAARRVECQLLSYGVVLDGVRWTEDGRLGTYYVEYGTKPRPTKVHFDRADTAFTRMNVDDVDWDALLDTRLLHLTGITAALSPTVLEILEEATRRASDAGIPLAFDVNYRANLWSPERAADVLRPFIEQAEILFVRSEDLHVLFGCSRDPEEALEFARTLTSAKYIAMTCGDLGVRALLDGQPAQSAARPVQIVDRLGAGDGFAAGFLHAWLDNDIDAATESGTAMAALALAQWGEQVATTREELAAARSISTADLSR